MHAIKYVKSDVIGLCDEMHCSKQTHIQQSECVLENMQCRAAGLHMYICKYIYILTYTYAYTYLYLYVYLYA